MQYLLYNISSTCFGLIRPSAGANRCYNFLTYTAYGVLGVVGVGLEESVLQCNTLSSRPTPTTPRTPYAVYVRNYNIYLLLQMGV